jgi:hypothetical protein
MLIEICPTWKFFEPLTTLRLDSEFARGKSDTENSAVFKDIEYLSDTQSQVLNRSFSEDLHFLSDSGFIISSVLIHDVCKLFPTEDHKKYVLLLI